MFLQPARSTLFPYTTLFRSQLALPKRVADDRIGRAARGVVVLGGEHAAQNRLNRSEEHTSELQSHHDLVCRLLLEKKKPSAFLDTTAIQPSWLALANT